MTIVSTESDGNTGTCGQVPNPADWGNLVANWQPGNAGQSLTGSAVNSCPNLISGGANPLTASSTARPTYSTTSWLSSAPKPGYTYDGSANVMRADGIAAYLTGEDIQATIIMCVQPAAVAGAKYLWSSGSSSSNNPIMGAKTANSAPFKLITVVAQGSDGHSHTPTGTTTITTTRYVMSWVFRGKTLDVWLNGVAELTGADIDEGVHLLDRFCIGGLVRSSVSAQSNIVQGGTLVYAGALDTQLVRYGEKYLTDIWPLV